jgi:hypothetical protein
MKKNVANKPKRKKWPIIVVAVVILLALVAIVGGGDKSTDTSADHQSQTPAVTDSSAVSAEETNAPNELSENLLLLADFQTADIMNGSGTEKVGQYGYISFSKTDMQTITSDQLLEFCETRYDGSDLNWVWIMFDDGTGIHIGPGYSAQMEYGTTDADTCTFSKIGAITRFTENENGETELSDSFTYLPY